MNKLHILFSFLTIFTLNSCVIESSEHGNVTSGPHAGYEIYLQNEWLITGNIDKFSLLLTIDGYLNCEDEAARDKIYGPHMNRLTVKDLGEGVYGLYRDKRPVYRLETGNRSLSLADSEWVLTDIRAFSLSKNTSWKAINRDAVFWDFESSLIKTDLRGEFTTGNANYSIYCTKNEITPDVLLRELQVYGNVKWRNSITVDCIISEALVYREMSDNFVTGEVSPSRGRIIQGAQNMLSGPVSSSRKYAIQSRTSSDELVILVEISVMNETEVFRKY
ncbi:MAG: hypothetical protein ACRCX4_15500 [Bacteroidales bacterium]